MGLGLLDAITKRLEHGPMIGWQKTVPSRHSSEFSAAYYFNHAFGIIANCESEDVTFSNENLYLAFMRIGNLIGTQFHPEKSQRAGYDFFSQAITKYWPKLK
jgi:imidazoleglycerol phosphate synthase glutamine amidotransferase subunit HisH